MPSATTPSTQPGTRGWLIRQHLVLLVFAVTLVDAGGCGESVALPVVIAACRGVFCFSVIAPEGRIIE
jgi:hypothetical protein